jgi:hypothetical protein
VPRRVEKSETAADPGPESARSSSIIIVPAGVGESRASRCIIPYSTVQYQPCLFSARACPVFQAYYNLVKRPPLARLTPLALSFAVFVN